MENDNKDFQSMMSSFMENTKKVQENLKVAYEQMAEKNQNITVRATAGGDLVTATVNLKMYVTDLDLKPALFDEKPEVMAELIIGAVNQGIQKAQEKVKGEMLNLSKEMGISNNMPFTSEKGE